MDRLINLIRLPYQLLVIRSGLLQTKSHNGLQLGLGMFMHHRQLLLKYGPIADLVSKSTPIKIHFGQKNATRRVFLGQKCKNWLIFGWFLRLQNGA